MGVGGAFLAARALGARRARFLGVAGAEEGAAVGSTDCDLVLALVTLGDRAGAGAVAFRPLGGILGWGLTGFEVEQLGTFFL